MKTNRRWRRAVSSMLAAAGLTGAAVLTSGVVAFSQELGAPGAATQGSAAVEQWTDGSGLTTDAAGHRLEGSAPDRADAAATTGATSAAADWSLLGPPGGDIYEIAASPADPAIVLAGFAPSGGNGGGLYRSGDGGGTWSEVAALHGNSVFAIEFTAAGTAYIGTHNGVWRSDDGGLTWVAANLNIGYNEQVFSVAVAPSDPRVLWIGIASALGFQKINVMRSTDGGATWANRTPPVGGALSGQAIDIDPEDPNTVIVGFDGGRLWVTRDGGTTWTDRSAGLPGGRVNDVVYDGTRLLVGGGQLFGSQFFGLYQSTDLGVTWTALHDNTWPVPVVTDIDVDPSDRNTIVVATAGTGVHRSTDGGATWQLTIGGTDALTGRAVRFQPGDSGTIFLGTDARAVYRSTDGGASFVQSSDGIAEIELHSVHANPLDPDELAIAFQGLNGGGVFSSVDGGVTWKPEPVPPTRYSAVRFAPDGTLYALSSGPSSVAPEGLYRRDADGSWTLLGPDQGSFYESALTTIRFSRVNPDLIVLGGSDFGYAGNEATVWRSLDRGRTWVKAYEGFAGQEVLDIEPVADGTGLEWVASVQDRTPSRAGIVVRSEDGGATWWPSMFGLPGGQFIEPRLCASSHDPRTMYLAATEAVNPAIRTVMYRTRDGGVTWEPTGWTGAALHLDLACDPAEGDVVYLLHRAEPRVIRSEDGGVSFAPFGDGLEGVRMPGKLDFAGTFRLLLASAKGSYATVLDRDTITLTAAVQRKWGRYLVNLSWQGATSSEVDIYRDGFLVATVPNDGSYTDSSRSHGTVSYKVCRVDSWVCSSDTTVRLGG